jgi:hypothetical protein
MSWSCRHKAIPYTHAIVCFPSGLRERERS